MTKQITQKSAHTIAGSKCFNTHSAVAQRPPMEWIFFLPFQSKTFNCSIELKTNSNRKFMHLICLELRRRHSIYSANRIWLTPMPTIVWRVQMACVRGENLQIHLIDKCCFVFPTSFVSASLTPCIRTLCAAPCVHC